LRYYLDFCHNYRFEPSKRQNIASFLLKLKDKKQDEAQQKQAAYTISIYYQIKSTGSETEFGDKATRKRNFAFT